MKNMRTLIKENLLCIIFIELFVFLASISCLLFLPLLRNGSIILGICFIVLFVLFGFVSFYASRKLISNLKYGKEMTTSVFIFYFFTLFLSGALITFIFIIIRAVDSNHFLLTQGFFTILNLTAYYFLLGLCFYIKKKDSR